MDGTFIKDLSLEFHGKCCASEYYMTEKLIISGKSMHDNFFPRAQISLTISSTQDESLNKLHQELTSRNSAEPHNAVNTSSANETSRLRWNKLDLIDFTHANSFYALVSDRYHYKTRLLQYCNLQWTVLWAQRIVNIHENALPRT